MNERLNGTLGALLKKYCASNHQTWDLHLPILEFTYNSTTQTSIATSPFLADLGWEPNAPTFMAGNRSNSRSDVAIDLIEKQKSIMIRTRDFLTDTQQVQEERANNQSSHRKEEFKVGDFVLLNREAYYAGGKYWKIQPIFVGLFKIIKEINKGAYELDLDRTRKLHRVINKYWFKKFHSRKEAYPKEPPRTVIELATRLHEITAVTGFNEPDQTYYVTMEEANSERLLS